MKKPLKRFLIMTQLLGLGALAATACTKNTSETKPVETSAKKDDATKQPTIPSVNNNDAIKSETVSSNKPKVLIQADEEKTIHTELRKIFNSDTVSKIIAGEPTTDNKQIEQLIAKQENEPNPDNKKGGNGENTPANHADENVQPLLSGIYSGNQPSNDLVAPAAPADLIGNNKTQS